MSRRRAACASSQRRRRQIDKLKALKAQLAPPEAPQLAAKEPAAKKPAAAKKVEKEDHQGSLREMHSQSSWPASSARAGKTCPRNLQTGLESRP